jgi:hypothetical protein
MSLTHQQEAFAQAVASGKSQSDAYRIAYPKSLKWKPDSVWNKSYGLAAKVEVRARIEAIKAELAERGLWTREDSARALIGVVQSPDKASDVVAAVKVLNEMNGFEAPKKVEHSGTVTAITRRVVDTKDGGQ